MTARTRPFIPLVILAAITFTAATAVAAEPAKPPFGDFTWMHGVNYTPSYAATDVETWLNYDPAVIDLSPGILVTLKVPESVALYAASLEGQIVQVFTSRREALVDVAADAAHGDDHRRHAGLVRHRRFRWLGA